MVVKSKKMGFEMLPAGETGQYIELRRTSWGGNVAQTTGKGGNRDVGGGVLTTVEKKGWASEREENDLKCHPILRKKRHWGPWGVPGRGEEGLREYRKKEGSRALNLKKGFLSVGKVKTQGIWGIRIPRVKRC